MENKEVTNMLNELGSASKIDIDMSTSCYYETDSDYLNEFIASRYEGSTDIVIIPIRFFQNFINNQANCYKNPFTREISGTDANLVDQVNLDNSLVWVERFLHIHKQSLLYIESPSSYVSVNASNYTKENGEYYFKSGDKPIKVTKDGIYDVTDSSNPVIIKPLKGTMPVIEYGYEGIDYPQANDLVTLQYNCIADVSWAIHNASIKLLSQPVVNSNENENDVKQKLRGYGKTKKLLKLGVTDSIKMVEVGNLQNMNDVYALYDKIIQQQAVRKGVDKFAVSIINSIQSGEAIKVQLAYINQIRRDFIPLYTKKEYEIFKVLRDIFNINVTLDKIEFPSLEYAF